MTFLFPQKKVTATELSQIITGFINSHINYMIPKVHQEQDCILHSRKENELEVDSVQS